MVAASLSPPPRWSTDVLQRLGTQPVPLDTLVTGIPGTDPPGTDPPGTGPEVTADEVETFLIGCPHTHQVDGGWVDLRAVADGAVLTHVLDEVERDEGVLVADGDLDLWARLATGRLPLAGGGEVWTRHLPDTATGADAELVGPDGWLDGFEDEQLLAVRLRDGALELTAVDDLPESDPTVLEHLLEHALAGVWAGFEAYTQLRDQDDAADAMVPIGWVTANLLTGMPGALATPLPPLSYLLEISGLDVRDAEVGLPGMPPDPDEAAELTDDQLRARLQVTALVQGCRDDPEALTGEDLTRLLELAADPATGHYLVDLVECEGLPSPVRDRLGEVARTSAEHALATLLAARAAEWDDDPSRAERLVTEALRHDPALVPALWDAGEYAATRGDVVAAEGFFKRAGLPRDDTPRSILTKLLTPPATGTARNQPCPCGSGRKYKMCCLRDAVHPLADRATLVYAKLVWWAQRPRFRDAAREFQELMDGGPQRHLLALDLAIFDTGLVDGFLRARGGLLPADERALVERWREQPIEPYEVAHVRTGVGATLRPLRGGEPVELTDRSFSTCVRRLDLLVARVLHDGLQPTLIALPALVPRGRRHELQRVFEDYSPATLAAFFGPQPPPVLQNRDGHELVFSEATYEVSDADAWQRLAGDLLSDEDDPDCLALVREVDELETVHRGTVRREGRSWLVETNSVERLWELQELVRAAAPDATLVEESTEPATEAMAERIDGGTGPQYAGPVASLPAGSGHGAGGAETSGASGASGAMAEFLRQYEQRWLDEPIPALDGRTPRQAASCGGPAAAELGALLDDIEWRGNEFMDAGRLRAELGVG